MFRRLMNFEEFRSAHAGEAHAGVFAEALRQQREFFRDHEAAEAVLHDGSLQRDGWGVWDDQAAVHAQ